MGREAAETVAGRGVGVGEDLQRVAAEEDLQRLVRRRTRQLKKDWGLSLVDLAERAHAAGYAISKHQLSQWANGQIRHVPYADTLRGIAKALDVPLLRVVDAAVRSTGIPRPMQAYPHEDDRATVRGICPPCVPRKEGFDEIVVVVPHDGLTNAEKAELRQAVEETIARQSERRTQSE